MMRNGGDIRTLASAKCEIALNSPIPSATVTCAPQFDVDPLVLSTVNGRGAVYRAIFQQHHAAVNVAEDSQMPSQMPRAMKTTRARSEAATMCTECGTSFADPRMAALHVRVTHEQRACHRCQHCAAIFGCARQLSAHILARHRRRSRYVHRCSHCTAAFASPTLLRQHEAAHAAAAAARNARRTCPHPRCSFDAPSPHALTCHFVAAHGVAHPGRPRALVGRVMRLRVDSAPPALPAADAAVEEVQRVLAIPAGDAVETPRGGPPSPPPPAAGGATVAFEATQAAPISPSPPVAAIVPPRDPPPLDAPNTDVQCAAPEGQAVAIALLSVENVVEAAIEVGSAATEEVVEQEGVYEKGSEKSQASCTPQPKSEDVSPARGEGAPCSPEMSALLAVKGKGQPMERVNVIYHEDDIEFGDLVSEKENASPMPSPRRPKTRRARALGAPFAVLRSRNAR